MLTAAPTGVAPLQITVCTPSAGLKTCWPMAKADYVMLSKSRKVAVQLHTEASWRANGKLISGHQPTTGKSTQTSIITASLFFSSTY